MFAVIATVITMLVAAAVWFTRKEVNTEGPFEYPIIRGLPWLFYYAWDSILDAFLVSTKMFEYRTFTIKWIGSPRYFIVTNPVCVEHILKTKFDNYPKGEHVHSALEDLFGDGIFAIDGEKWEAQRKTALHMFSAREFRENIIDVFNRHGAELLEILGHHADNGKPIDLHELFHRFTLDSIGEVAYGISIGSLQDPETPFARAFDDAQATILHRFKTPGWRLVKWFKPREWRLRTAIKVLNNYCNEIISSRRSAAEAAGPDAPEGRDVLSRCMTLKKPDGSFLFDDKGLRDVILNFIIAGRDTTAQALSWAMVCLMGLHPGGGAKDALALVQAESDAYFGGSSSSASAAHAVSYEGITERFPYTQAAFLEALRLYPSVPNDMKYVVKDDILPDGVKVTAGSNVIYLPMAMGSCPLLWGPDAAEFKPPRMQSGLKVSPYKYIAFNAGQRTCLGQQMATVEATYVLALLNRSFNFSVVPGQVIRAADSLTLPMRYGLNVTVTRRSTGGPRE